MKTKRFFLFSLLLGIILPKTCFSHNVKILTIKNSIISPVSAHYIRRGLNSAIKDNDILIIELDTPGGLLNSAEEIVKMLLNSPVPVVTYITPSGARAASAGVFISYASHILAMSPSTHLGAAHPVLEGGRWGQLNKEIQKKIINDTVAWAKNIANKRLRPERFIVEAITQSRSLTEKEALTLKVCDVIAANLDELLKKINGKEVKTSKGIVKLSLKGSSRKYLPLNFKEKLLTVVVNPNVAYLLFLMGVLGLIFEVTHPGFGFPGIAGTIALILALYAFSILPLNYTGLALLILGIILILTETLTPSFGIFLSGGIIALFLGSVMLFNHPLFFKVSFKLFMPVIALFSILTLILAKKAIDAHRRRPRTGKEGLIGEESITITTVYKTGKVRVYGEIWDAYSEEPIEESTPVVVKGVNGLRLIVKRRR